MQQPRKQQEEARERASLWKLGGLTPIKLLKRVGAEMSEDDVCV
jgi:hypothetical protein